MPAWLYETASPPAASLVGFGVLDALGMRLGTVEGWVWTPEATLAYLEVCYRSVLRENRHLVPLGYVVQVDAGHRYVHLRELTRRTLAAHCPRIDERRMPDADVLAAGIEAAPAPRPDIVLRLRRPEAGVDGLVPERIAVQQSAARRPSDSPSLLPSPGVPAWGSVVDARDEAPSWTPLTEGTVPSVGHGPGPWQPLLPDEPTGDTAPR